MPAPEIRWTAEIPAGIYTIGTPPALIAWLCEHTTWAAEWARDDLFALEAPQTVTLTRPFRLAVYPVTVGDYRAFVAAGGYRTPAWWSAAGEDWRQSQNVSSPAYWDDPLWTGDPLLPVVGVSWHEADAYCRWLSDVTGRTLRLPTEVEWEITARGSDGRIYPWGDSYQPFHANINETFHNLGARYVGHTTPVDAHPPGASPFGALDMCGNVWEWCANTFENLADMIPHGLSRRATRGGSWHNAASTARAAYRSYGYPGDRRNNLGFRLLLDGA